MLGHYLPQSYLERFTSRGRLHVFDRATGKARRDSPRNVAAITDYYVLTSPSGDRDESIEHGLLSMVESAAHPALSRLARLEAISDEEHDIIATFLAFLCTRLPSFEATYAKANEQLGREFFRRAAGTPERAGKFLASHRKSFPYQPEEFAAFVNSEALRFPPDKAQRIQLMIEHSEPLIAGFKSMDWWLWHATGSRRFLTSDAPFGFIPLEGAPPTYGELSPRVLKFIALTPEACLMLADRQRDQPFLTTKEMDDDGVRDISAGIALAATRLVIARDRADLDAAIEETGLRSSTFTPRTGVVDWSDTVEERSFSLSVRIHHDTKFPLHLPLEWTCRSCGSTWLAQFSVTNDLAATNPRAYVEWLDTPCLTCSQPPRRTKSRLAGEEPVQVSLPPDE
jgi:uncharacterized protein DUF4238